jgi:hypothetical protein
VGLVSRYYFLSEICGLRNFVNVYVIFNLLYANNLEMTGRTVTPEGANVHQQPRRNHATAKKQQNTHH